MKFAAFCARGRQYRRIMFATRYIRHGFTLYSGRGDYGTGRPRW